MSRKYTIKYFFELSSKVPYHALLKPFSSLCVDYVIVDSVDIFYKTLILSTVFDNIILVVDTLSTYQQLSTGCGQYCE